ncbi:MAG: hypothetical protein DRP83_00755 [Planctomycetota bacterium]|nr:MAG: hypothetical protein DRP83_00755 [Planctomycetota bacterium]
MLWLSFPSHIDIPRFIEQTGVKLDSLAEITQEHAEDTVLVHVVYSTERPPQAVIYDSTDSIFVPVNLRGLSVSVPYLLPRGLVGEMLSAIKPISQPGNVRPKSEPKSD